MRNFNLLLLGAGEDDEAFHDLLNDYVAGKLDTLPDGFEQHALFLQWRDQNKDTEPTGKGIGPLVVPALKYIAWCKAGLIPDEHYNKRVADAYGLSSVGVVNNWVTRYPMPSTPETPTEAEGIDVELGMVLAGDAYQHRKQ